MNVIITLPPKFIQLIKEGKKSIELRKTCPIFFEPQKDVIYVCEKGTKSVVGYMTIKQIICANNKFAILEGWSKNIAVPQKWIANYIKDAEELYGFFIGGYKSFYKPLSLNEYFHRLRAPQSFMYTYENYR